MTRFSTMPIVVPIDFSEEADRAMEMALEIAADPANILAVHVAAPLAALEPGMVWEMASDEVRGRRTGKGLPPALRRTKVRPNRLRGPLWRSGATRSRPSPKKTEPA